MMDNKLTNNINWKPLFPCISCVIGITIGQAYGSKIVLLASLCIYLLIMVLCDTSNLFSILCFFLPWSAVMKLSPTSISFCTIGFLCVFVKILYINKWKLKKEYFYVFSAIACLTFLSKMVHGYSIVNASHIVFLLMLIFFPIYIEENIDYISLEQVAIFFASGILLATATALLLQNNPNLMAYVGITDEGYVRITRISGFYPDPNFYSAQIITAIGCMLLLIKKSKLNLWLQYTILMLLIVAGMIAVSKSFVISLLILLLIWMISLLIEKGELSTMIRNFALFLIFSFVLLSTDIAKEYVADIMARFEVVDSTQTLTTGRNLLWLEYVNYFIDNPIELLIGKGFTSVFLGVHKGSHNTLIQCLYQLGTLGTGVLYLIVHRAVWRIRGVTKGDILEQLMMFLACFSMWMGIDTLFWDDFFITISIYIICTHYICTENRSLSFYE